MNYATKLSGMLLTLLLTMFCALSIPAQEEITVKKPESEKECDHTSGYGRRFVNTQLHAPARVTDFDGQKIEISYEFQPNDVRLETWYLSPISRLDESFVKDWKKGEWWILFCERDNHVYFVERFDPRQKVKKK